MKSFKLGNLYALLIIIITLGEMSYDEVITSTIGDVY